MKNPFVKRLELESGFVMPRGWGKAWVDYSEHQVVVMPLGANWVAAWAVWAWRFIAFPKTPMTKKHLEQKLNGVLDRCHRVTVENYRLKRELRKVNHPNG